MNCLRAVFIVVMILTASGFVRAQQLQYKHYYTCNKERVMVAYCRRDSDQPGFDPTDDAHNYCTVIYPDRPRPGGIMIQTVELRSDIIKMLSACGAFGEGQQAKSPQATSSSRPVASSANNTPSGNAQPSATNAPDSEAVRAHLEAGDNYLKAKDYKNAIIHYQKAIDLKPKSLLLIDAYNGIASSYSSSGQYEKAIPFYEALVTGNSNWLTHWALADSYFNTHQYAKAAGEFKEAVRLNPTEGQNYYDLGLTYIILGRNTEAMQVYNAFSKINATDAKDLLDKINDPGGPASVLASQSIIQLMRGDEALGLEYAHAGLRYRPANPVGLLKVGEALEAWEHYDEAITAYRAALALNPKVETKADAHLYIGEAYRELKQYTESIKEIKESIRLRPSEYANVELGKTYTELKDYPNALAAYQEAIRLKADNADAFYSIGLTYAAMNQYDKAIAAFMEVERVEPKTGRGYTGIGNLNLQLKKIPEAGRAYSNALRIEPKNTEALFGIGKAYLAVGRKPDAMRAYTALKQLDEQLAEKLLKEINVK